jgi:hypothetical protein
VYSNEVIDAAQARQKRIGFIKKRFPDDPIAKAEKYTSVDLLFKAIVLVAEGVLVGYLTNKGIKCVTKK